MNSLSVRLLTGLLPALFCFSTMATDIPIEQLERNANAVPGSIAISPVLAGQIPGVTTDWISLTGPVHYCETADTNQEVVWFFLDGKGVLQTRTNSFLVEEETIARAPLGWAWTIDVDKEQTFRALRVRKQLNDEDRAEIAKSSTNPEVLLVKRFTDCKPYGEAIKSAKTVSRTLLPENIVPRMAAGTVETSGPDEVGRHKHPMLEQLFVGLRDNHCTVSADETQTNFPEFSILHIPLGSMHGAKVAAGNKLYYIWLDFFATKAGQEWLKMHKPITEEKK